MAYESLKCAFLIGRESLQVPPPRNHCARNYKTHDTVAYNYIAFRRFTIACLLARKSFSLSPPPYLSFSSSLSLFFTPPYLSFFTPPYLSFSSSLSLFFTPPYLSFFTPPFLSLSFLSPNFHLSIHKIYISFFLLFFFFFRLPFSTFSFQLLHLHIFFSSFFLLFLIFFFSFLFKIPTTLCLSFSSYIFLSFSFLHLPFYHYFLFFFSTIYSPSPPFHHPSTLSLFPPFIHPLLLPTIHPPSPHSSSSTAPCV